MSGRKARLRARVAPLSSGHRRWARFLASLPLDPDALTPPIDPLSDDDFILCGCPRTGTTLLAAALFQPPAVVTVMEPWDGMRLAPHELFRSLRQEIETSRQLTRGRLDIGALEAANEVRWCTEGMATRLDVSPGWQLGVKWPGYWRFLPLLHDTRFIVTLRHPYEVVASFRSQGGRVGAGLQYDTAFNRALNATLSAATEDEAVRRVLLFDYVHERLLPHLEQSNVLVVRYERWFSDHEGQLADIAEFLGTEIRSGQVEIRPPKGTSWSISPEDRRAVQSYCRTAGALGYELD